MRTSRQQQLRGQSATAPPEADDSHRGASQSNPNSVREWRWFRRDEADCRSDCGHDYFYDPCPDSGACVLCAYERTSTAAWHAAGGATETVRIDLSQSALNNIGRVHQTLLEWRQRGAGLFQRWVVRTLYEIKMCL